MMVFKMVKQHITKEEPISYSGGGGGKGGTAPAPAPIQSTTTTTPAGISQLLGGASERYDEREAVDKKKSIDKKKMGTRGLQIPLSATGSNTGTGPTPASTGVNI